MRRGLPRLLGERRCSHRRFRSTFDAPPRGASLDPVVACVPGRWLGRSSHGSSRVLVVAVVVAVVDRDRSANNRVVVFRRLDFLFFFQAAKYCTGCELFFREQKRLLNRKKQHEFLPKHLPGNKLVDHGVTFFEFISPLQNSARTPALYSATPRAVCFGWADH